MEDYLVSGVKRGMMDFEADMVNPGTSAHAPNLDAWASAICGTLGRNKMGQGIGMNPEGTLLWRGRRGRE